MKKYVIGIDVGGTKILYGVFDNRMNLLRVIQRATDQELTPEIALHRVLDITGDAKRALTMRIRYQLLEAQHQAFIVQHYEYHVQHHYQP